MSAIYKDIRRKNFNKLLDERTEGSPGMMARIIGWKPNKTSAIKNGHSNLSDSNVLELSERFKLPHGWFDRDNEEMDDRPVIEEARVPKKGTLSFVAEGFSLELELKGEKNEQDITRLALEILSLFTD